MGYYVGDGHHSFTVADCGPGFANAFDNHANLPAALRRAGRDARGVVLRTVIVIVVLLMIAGGVSAVLLSRSSGVMGQLEAQGVGAITEDNCPITEVAGKPRVPITVIAGKSVGTDFLAATDQGCWWESGEITAAQCFAAANGRIVELGAIGDITPQAGDKNGCMAKIA